MAAINTQDIWLLGLVSVIAVYRLTDYARRVGESRKKFKINPPSVEGPEEFQRTFRAQQNVLEFAPVFFMCLWVSGIFFHQVPASIVGLIYVYAREQYFNGYCETAGGRIDGFQLGVKCLYAFLAMCLIGILRTGIEYFSATI